MRLPTALGATPLDVVRIQELFSGFDPSLLERPEDSGIYDPEVTRARNFRESPEAAPPVGVAFKDSEGRVK